MPLSGEYAVLPVHCHHGSEKYGHVQARGPSPSEETEIQTYIVKLPEATVAIIAIGR